MKQQLSKQTIWGFLIKQRQHELYQSSTWGPDFAALLWFEELFTIAKTWCVQFLGCLQDQSPSVEKKILDLNTNILGLAFFPPKIPLPPLNVFRDSYKKKDSVFSCFTKYRSTRSVNSTQNILPFDFKTLWTLDEGSEKDNNMFTYCGIPKKAVGILNNFFLTCI